MADAQPDVINLHFLGPYSAFPDDLEGCPLVVSTWGAEIIPMVAEPESDRIRKVEILQRARSVVALSHFLAAATARYAELPADRVETLYWGVDLGQFTPKALPCEAPVIGFVKHLSPKYGADDLIEALPRIIEEVPQARVLMLGKGPQEEALRAMASRLGVASAIDWVGGVEHDRIPGYYASMALSVMPSTHESETLGIAALESQAMQVPVVASRIGGIPESVLDGRTGLLAPPRRPDALAEAILKLLLDRQYRLQLGRQGREYIERRFNWDDTIKGMVAILREAVHEGDRTEAGSRSPGIPGRLGG